MVQGWTFALHAAAARIFEELCFMMEEEGPDEAASPMRSASVSFRGGLDGTLVVSVSDGMLSSVVSNMLGDEAVSEESLRDGLGELANVICGNLMPMVVGEGAVVRLDAPQLAEPPSGEPSASSLLHFESGDARVALYLDEAS